MDVAERQRAVTRAAYALDSMITWELATSKTGAELRDWAHELAFKLNAEPDIVVEALRGRMDMTTRHGRAVFYPKGRLPKPSAGFQWPKREPPTLGTPGQPRDPVAQDVAHKRAVAELAPKLRRINWHAVQPMELREFCGWLTKQAEQLGTDYMTLHAAVRPHMGLTPFADGVPRWTSNAWREADAKRRIAALSAR